MRRDNESRLKEIKEDFEDRFAREKRTQERDYQDRLKDEMKILEKDVDFVTVGRAGILHHDFPKRVIADERFEPIKLPVSKEHLTQEGLSETFIKYMQRWQGFVEE